MINRADCFQSVASEHVGLWDRIKVDSGQAFEQLRIVVIGDGVQLAPCCAGARSFAQIVRAHTYTHTHSHVTC
jgi:hypothetical protein